jgi:hypothetical protein
MKPGPALRNSNSSNDSAVCKSTKAPLWNGHSFPLVFDFTHPIRRTGSLQAVAALRQLLHQPAHHFRAVCFLPQIAENAPIGRNGQLRRNIKVVGKKRDQGASMNTGEPAREAQNQNQNEDEARRIRRLQVMMSMVTSVISQDPALTVEEASELAAGAKRAALAMFPDKELAYDILYKPRLQRLMQERFRLQ